MDNTRTFKGRWFLPNDSENILSGTFHFDRENGCFLETIESFEGFLAASDRINIILGATMDGGEITLLECVRTHQKTNFNGVSVTRYFAHFAFVGAHFPDDAMVKFDHLQASIADIEQWIGIYGVESLQLDLSNIGVNVSYKLPNSQTFIIDDDLKVFFTFECKLPHSKNSSVLEICQTSFIGIQTSTELPVRRLLDKFSILYKFLVLPFYDSPNIISLRLKNSSLDSPNPRKNTQIEVLYSDNLYNREYVRGKEHYKFLFTYIDIKESFSRALKRWFSLYEVISPSINLFTEQTIRKGIGLELQFLGLMQSIETFHRGLYGGIDVPVDVHMKRMQTITESVPASIVGWLKEKLAFSNEPSLRRRLKELLELIPEEVCNKLIVNKKDFISYVVSTRNYYTHYNPSLKNSIYSEGEILKCVEKLKIFFVSLMLSELEFSKEQILQFVQVEKLYPYGSI